MRTIVRIKFGSHLFGTDTPLSDLDYKSVYIPDARDILLQRVKGTISTNRPKAEGEKNYAGEVDEEAYSLQKYLGLVAEGQTVALDMLFAPSWSWTYHEKEWIQIKDNYLRLVTRKSTAFVGYCRQQANKYGIKGSRVAAAREALQFLEVALERYGTTARLSEVERDIGLILENHKDHMAVLDIPGATDVHGERRTVRHWEVCNRKLPFTQTIKASAEIMRRLVGEYGHRALQAERQEGIDWKALSHAVRVANEAIELLTKGYLTFPSPNREHLLAIKTGKVSYQDIAKEIDELLPAVEAAAEQSNLPYEPDLQWIDDFVASVYASEI